MRVPDQVRRSLREKLWAVADQLDWSRLSWMEKTARYEAWTRDSEVGGLLSHYMDQRQIRVYIKDTIMKGYVRSRQANTVLPFSALGIDSKAAAVDAFERPHGRRLEDGRVIVWGNAEDWKLLVTAAFERSWGIKGARPFGVVLMAASGRFAEPSVRAMVESAASGLHIQKVVWVA